MLDNQILELLKKAETEKGYTPSFRELAEITGKSTFTVSESLKRLEKQKRITVTRRNGRIIARGINVR